MRKSLATTFETVSNINKDTNNNINNDVNENGNTNENVNTVDNVVNNGDEHVTVNDDVNDNTVVGINIDDYVYRAEPKHMVGIYFEKDVYKWLKKLTKGKRGAQSRLVNAAMRKLFEDAGYITNE